MLTIGQKYKDRYYTMRRVFAVAEAVKSHRFFRTTAEIHMEVCEKLEETCHVRTVLRDLFFLEMCGYIESEMHPAVGRGSSHYAWKWASKPWIDG